MDHSKFNDGIGDDWEDKNEDFVWNERDWEAQLSQSATAIRQFVLLYQQLKGESPAPVGILNDDLGWQDRLFSQIEVSSPEDLNKGEEDEEDSEEGIETVFFMQPAFVALRGLSFYICELWETFIRSYEEPLAGIVVSAFLVALKETEIQSILMLQALEAGEFGLVNLCSKRTLFLLNRLFDGIRALGMHPQKQKSLDQICQVLTAILFDYREIVLKIKAFAQKESTEE